MYKPQHLLVNKHKFNLTTVNYLHTWHCYVQKPVIFAHNLMI